ncbi:MAG TPA: SAM-dependent methyltransferase [Woeseiaceae bacterium]|nr:SAM-dependent methyltransferase [Woeseiaceae bacterium]
MSGPRRSSGSWRDRQERDPFVRKARVEGWRSRAVFKLEQIAAKEPILFPGMVCVDLGSAPGGWSQYVATRLNNRVRIVAMDLLPMDSLPCVEFLQADFSTDEGLALLLRQLDGTPVDLVMSDLAPNISGNRAIDQPRAMHLAELALDTARKVLRYKGNFVCKLFQGEGTDDFVALARESFEKVRIMKPKASRDGSSEVYLVARNYRL